MRAGLPDALRFDFRRRRKFRSATKIFVKPAGFVRPRSFAGTRRAGVASLKIEGRLKSPEYVASITRVYRKPWMI
jgi:collagenase-like PrtC family protease